MSSSDEKPGKKPLVCTPYVIQDLTGAVYRLFQLHTENITIRFDEGYIQILVFFDPDAPIVLPDSEPLEIRFHRGGKQEYIHTRARYL